MLDPTTKTRVAIPTKIVKLVDKQIFKDLANCINEYIKQNKFPNELKIAHVTAIFKKDKTNDRPISILPAVSKIFERVLCNQLKNFSNNSFRLFSVNLGKGTVLNMSLLTFFKYGKGVLMRLRESLEHYRSSKLLTVSTVI